mmetsp:Transcript_142541/g.248686  ORF Transcript_142541/g.248686 Transcript_142541/m.248686 type:complete len:216 (+) Transcript_142541:317-964(+)
MAAVSMFCSCSSRPSYSWVMPASRWAICLSDSKTSETRAFVFIVLCAFCRSRSTNVWAASSSTSSAWVMRWSKSARCRRVPSESRTICSSCRCRSTVASTMSLRMSFRRFSWICHCPSMRWRCSCIMAMMASDSSSPCPSSSRLSATWSRYSARAAIFLKLARELPRALGSAHVGSGADPLAAPPLDGAVGGFMTAGRAPGRTAADRSRGRRLSV